MILIVRRHDAFVVISTVKSFQWIPNDGKAKEYLDQSSFGVVVCGKRQFDPRIVHVLVG
jgi:hypothetical protein